MATTPTFGTQIIGQTENALNAILERQLAGTGLTEPQWVTLTIAVMGGGTIDRGALLGRAVGALKLSDAQAQQLIDELSAAGLVDGTGGDRSPVSVTDAGAQVHGRVRATVAEITERLWGDIPDDDLAIAGRVLGIVLDRANSELAGA